jgi:hypothetical protein
MECRGTKQNSRAESRLSTHMATAIESPMKGRYHRIETDGGHLIRFAGARFLKDLGWLPHTYELGMDSSAFCASL